MTIAEILACPSAWAGVVFFGPSKSWALKKMKNKLALRDFAYARTNQLGKFVEVVQDKLFLNNKRFD